MTTTRIDAPTLPVDEKTRRERQVAYLLWATLGLLGAHRWWWGKLGTGLAQMALGISAPIVFIFGAYDYLAKLFEDNARMNYDGELTQIALGLAMALAALAWLARDGFRIKTWGPRRWRVDP